MSIQVLSSRSFLYGYIAETIGKAQEEIPVYLRVFLERRIVHGTRRGGFQKWV